MSELRTNVTYWLLAIVFVLASWMAPVRGAEIQLRSTAIVDGRVVVLGDVADIVAATADERKVLSAIELIPMPVVDAQKSLSLREVQDLLALRGVATGQHFFGGASEVQLASAASQAAHKSPAFRPNGSAARGAITAVENAIVKHLSRNVDADRDWQVAVELTDEQVALVQTFYGRIVAEGGSQPWQGRQQFIVRLGTAEKQLSIDAEIQMPDTVVVAARSLVKGDVLRASDLILEPAKRGVAQRGAFRSLDDIVGQEAVRPVVAGQVLDANYVRAPVLVGRGDVVTVYAYSGGIRVKTTGRSRQPGAKGELVEIESLADRRRFFARVADVQVVEVFASAAQATPTAAADTTTAQR
ncbi:MAG: flagellar basal body P-ring formation chaperone FlgA [Pirellulales bacterium]